MASRNLTARNPLKNIGANPPTRKIVGPDGVVRKEKLCPIPFSRKFIAPDGAAVTIPLATGFTIRGFKGNDYGVQKLEEKLKAGFLPYDECPLAARRVPWGGEKPCEGKFSEEECCPHLAKIAEARQAEHRAQQMEYGKNFQTQQDRMIKLLEQQAARIGEPLVQPSAPAPAGKKGVSGG